MTLEERAKEKYGLPISCLSADAVNSLRADCLRDAAPELLDALKDCVNQIRALCSESDIPDGAEVAIKKAGGQ